MSFIAELKRRNVFKVAIAYVVVAWLVAQVLQLVFESFGTPEWVMKTVLVLMAAGLLFALFFAWAFELTPEGLKREHEVDRSQSITPQTGKKLNNLIFVLMALAIIYLAYDKLALSASREAALIEATKQAVTEQVASEVSPRTAALEEASVEGEDSSAGLDRSIAVLPFADMSPNRNQEYFSDGLSEELLNLLAKVPELKVAARTSSFSLKGKEMQIAEVGEILKVAHVLEGSVRTAGDRVRITTQLIHVADGYHLWSETYDRTLDDIFAIQDEIAATVVEQLKVTLLGEKPHVQETDPAAYELFLRARHLSRQQTAEGWEQSNELYQQTLAIDETYVAAWNGLATNYRRQASSGLLPYDEGYHLSREAAQKALSINPEFAPAHANLGWIEMDNDPAKSAQHYERALALDPSDLDALRNAAALLQSLGRWEQSIELGKYVAARDPVDPVVHHNLGFTYLNAGHWDKAIESFQTGLQLSPDMIGTNYQIGIALLSKGELEAALTAISDEKFEGWRLIGLTAINHAMNRVDESNAALEELILKYEKDAAFNIAYLMAFRGEVDKAFEWLEKELSLVGSISSEITTERFFENLHDDPRWLPFLESIGKSPEQLAAIEFEVKLPK